MLVERRVDSTRLIAECDAALRDAADDVLRKFEALQREGLALRDGTRIRFGWSILTLRAETGGLRVCEPAFDGDPLRETSPTINVTLRVLAGQVRVLKCVHESGSDVGFEELVLVRQGALEAPGIFLRRQKPVSPNDSGWLIGDLDHIEETGGDLTPTPVYALVRSRPAALAVLALPVDYTVVMRGAEISNVFDATGQDRWG
jgi:hypothetical protein